ncbi:SMI1/KNR4 family protein [Bacillus velezensis]|nr:SMI1/KNR4 family protein [Bacillus velezensis]MDF3256338.1 SMI1/KNR4 family protein [Bacillus velezensis]MDF3269407.1 SMI1/KNR4 family protein [Bacillus velezensis]
MEDAAFQFRDPASPQEVSNLEKKLGMTLPKDKGRHRYWLSDNFSTLGKSFTMPKTANHRA